MGTAIKLTEYCRAFDLDFLSGAATHISITLSVMEAVLGAMLILGVWPRFTSTFSIAVMAFFTFFTLFIAMTNPVADCGCFGDAIKLSNWESFLKNVLLLLPLSVAITVNAWMRPARKGIRGGALMCAVFGVFAVLLNIYCLRHLPLIDFLPYKKGVNIPEAISAASDGAGTKLLYRDLDTGTVMEFAISDTTWHDESQWEYVNTIVKVNPLANSAAAFAIIDSGADVTMKLLSRPGALFMLCVESPSRLNARQTDALFRAAQEARARDYAVIAITPVPLTDTPATLCGQGCPVKYFNIDDVTLKSLLRAETGLVVVRDGTIIDKMGWRDIPLRGRFRDYRH